MAYATLLETNDQADRATQSQCAEDAHADGRCDAALGTEIKPGELHPEYVNALLSELREKLTDPNRAETLSIRWLSPAFMSGGYDEF